jgi:hypothetical protein
LAFIHIAYFYFAAMDAHLELIRRMLSAQTGLAVTIDQRPKPVLASDDRDHQRQPECAGASEGTRRAADTEPNRQRVLERARVNSLPGECRAVLARPVNMNVRANLQKQVELLGEE